MKKALLLSVVASGFIFAGGDIAPAAPVVPAAAPAACDFWGSIGARYEFKDNGDLKFGDKENNTWKTTVVLGVEKKLGYGFGFGAEVAATSQLGLKDIAAPMDENAELSELYLTYKTGNTAFKMGRQALPKSLSPWAWTDTTLNRKDITYEGIVVVNTDIQDTVLAGAWIARAGMDNSFVKVDTKDNKGLFAIAVQNKSLANTTLTATAYYINKPVKGTSVWASAETKAGSVDLGLQVAYSKLKGLGLDKTIGVAGYIGGKLADVDAKLTLAYIDDGESTLVATKALGLGGSSGFWGSSFAGAFGGDVVAGNKQKIARLDLGYKIPNAGKIYFSAAYDKPDSGEKAYGAALGYKFKVSGIKGKVEYRYIKNKDFTKRKDQRIRVEGVYNF